MNGRTNVVNNNSDSLGGIIPLEAPNNFVVVADNAKCLLTWIDPKDKYADELGEITDEGDQLVSQFAYTRIVRKTTGYPSGPNDGDIVTESSTRNQYQSTAYSDEGLVNNTLYYYAAFTCNTDGVWSGSITGSATPKAYDPILANNTWEQINEVANEGIAASVWSIGDEIDITLTTGETLTCVIAGFDHHLLADGSGTAAITFVTKHLLAWRDNDNWCFSTLVYRDQTSSNIQCNYNESNAFKYCQNQAINELPIQLSRVLQSIKSQYNIVGIAPTYRITNYTAKIFQLAINEIINGIGVYDGAITMYSNQIPYYITSSNRIKKLNNGAGNANIYGVSANGDNEYGRYTIFINKNGNDGQGNYSSATHNTGMSFAFCIGKTPS